MIPHINARGHSFKGVMAYLCHDKDHATTTERVAWHETGNLLTDDPLYAARKMAATDLRADELKRANGHNGAGASSCAGAVYHYSLSWAHGEQHDRDHMRECALATLAQLGLSDHQFVMVCHDDTEHAHLHVVANLTHPETGYRHDTGLDKRAIQEWALAYEREHGMHCHEREKNAQLREQGEPTKYQDKKQDYAAAVTQAFERSDSGAAFIHALREEGLELAKARRGNAYVLVDEQGNIQKLSRQLDITAKGKEKTQAIHAKLADIDPDALLDGDALAHRIKQQAIETPNTPEPLEEAEEVTASLNDVSPAVDAPALPAEDASCQEEPLCRHIAEEMRYSFYSEEALPTEIPQQLPHMLPDVLPELPTQHTPSGGIVSWITQQIERAMHWLYDRITGDYLRESEQQAAQSMQYGHHPTRMRTFEEEYEP